MGNKNVEKMDLRDKLVSSFLAFQNHVDVDHPVHDIRSEAIKNFEIQGFPDKKQEAWKYTSLKGLQKTNFSIFPKKVSALEYRDVKQYFLHEMDTYKIVFIDGIFNGCCSKIMSRDNHHIIDTSSNSVIPLLIAKCTVTWKIMSWIGRKVDIFIAFMITIDGSS